MSRRNSGSKAKKRDHQDGEETGRKNDDFVMVDESSLHGFDGAQAAADNPATGRSLWSSIKTMAMGSSSLTYVQSKRSTTTSRENARSMERKEPEVTRAFSAPTSAQMPQKLQYAVVRYDDQPTKSVYPPAEQSYFLNQMPDPRSRLTPGYPSGHPPVAGSSARFQPAFSNRSERRRGSGEEQLSTTLHPCVRPVTPEPHLHDLSNDPESVKVKEFLPGTSSMAAHGNQQSGTNDNLSTTHDENGEDDDHKLQMRLSEHKLTQVGAVPGEDSSPPVNFVWYESISVADTASMLPIGRGNARESQDKGIPSEEAEDSADESDKSESSLSSAMKQLQKQDEAVAMSAEMQLVAPPPSSCTRQGTSASDRRDAIAVANISQDSDDALDWPDWSDNDDAGDLKDSGCESGHCGPDTTRESVPVACDDAEGNAPKVIAKEKGAVATPVDKTYRPSPQYPVSDSACANATVRPGMSSRKSQLSKEDEHMSDRRQRTLPPAPYRKSAEHDAYDTSDHVIYKPPFPPRSRTQEQYFQDAGQQLVKKTAQAATGDAAKPSNFTGRTGISSAISPNTAAAGDVCAQPHGSRPIGAITHTMNAPSSTADQLPMHKKSTAPGFPAKEGTPQPLAMPARRSPLPPSAGKEFWSKLLAVPGCHEFLTEPIPLFEDHILVPPIFRHGTTFHCRFNEVESRMTKDPTNFFQIVRSVLKLKRVLATEARFATPKQSGPHEPELVLVSGLMTFLTENGSHVEYECEQEFRTAGGCEPGTGQWVISGVFLKNLSVSDRRYHRL